MLVLNGINQRDVKSDIGNKTDSVGVPYSFDDNSILGHLNTAYYHVHGQSFVYPNHSDAIVITAGSGAWDLTGTITQIIPTGALTIEDFDLHWINISSISGNGEIQIDVYADTGGGNVLVSATRPHRNAVQSQEGARRIQVPQQPSGTKISCQLSDSTGGQLSCGISFEGHYYA